MRARVCVCVRGSRTHALIAITIPLWQWVACAQYSHMGCVSITGTSNVPTVPLAPPSNGMKPELTPPLAKGWHGVNWVDCVTVWLRAPNWNCRTSPGCATTEFGVKVRVGPPTRIVIRRVLLPVEEVAGLGRRSVVTGRY